MAHIAKMEVLELVRSLEATIAEDDAYFVDTYSASNYFGTGLDLDLITQKIKGDTDPAVKKGIARMLKDAAAIQDIKNIVEDWKRKLILNN